jgi:hypothetical protein
VSKEIIHSHIQDASLLHISFNYIQPTDPGAVGYKQIWLDTSVYRLKFRNSTNTQWVTI